VAVNEAGILASLEASTVSDVGVRELVPGASAV